MVMLDDDMELTESVIHQKSMIDYPGLLSHGRFSSLKYFPESTYKRPFDLVEATTSLLGKKVRDSNIPLALQGRAVGNRDQTIDYLLAELGPNGNNDYSFCHIEPEEINQEAIIQWQGLAAVTGKTDCHATASLQGLAAAAHNDIEHYGNLFVNYGIYAGISKVGLASEWKESTTAACGIFNINPIPGYPFIRGGHVAYRHLLSKDNPVALSSVAVDHNRSSNGRPKLSRIYIHEILGAKVCRNLKEAVVDRGWDLSKISEITVDQKRDILRSLKKTSAVLDNIRNNGNTALADYTRELLQDVGDFFSHHTIGSFWQEESFKKNVFESVERNYTQMVNDTQLIFKCWEEMQEKIKKNNSQVRKIE